MVVAGRRVRVDGRRRQSRRFSRLVLTVLVLSGLLLAGNSIMRSSAKGPDEAVAFADRVRPAVGRSTRQASALEALRSQVGTLGKDGLSKGVERLLREARSLSTEVAKVRPPSALSDAHGLLVTCLTTRVTALAAMDATLSGAFESGPPEQAVNALVDVGRDLAVSDRAYELFLAGLPAGARKTMPASVWLADDTRYGRPEMAAFVNTLRASASLAPVRDVSVITVTVDPAPVSVAGGGSSIKVLPVSRTLKLQVVVANAGNVAEKHLAVEAVVTSTGGMDTARQFVDLAPGQRATVALTLHPSPVGVLELKVRAGPAAGEASIADNEQVSSYEMR
ncbi:MAG: hypothetical protein QOF60_276 [Actinomycetota bacterium]|jgi:hypothetical protein|nr:hypothetical protein [Actinomycetota bacterium]